MTALSLLFAGTPQFAVPALAALLGSEHRVIAVYTQPDRPAGRGREVAMSAVKQCALSRGIPVEQPPTLRDAAALERLASWSADLMVVVAYGLLLPEAVLRTPPLGCVNIHASLLPRWRGAAPIQRAIEAGDARTGVSIMQMDAGLDTGPILLERAAPIGSRDTAASLQERLAALGAEALLSALAGLQGGALQARAQADAGVTYAAKISKHEALVDWSRPAVDIDRQVRAFNPWPVAETRWRDEQVRIWEALPLSSHAPQRSGPPGAVVASSAEGVDVATGEGVLRLLRLQLPGRKPLASADFVKAQRLDGAVFGSQSMAKGATD
jgi:methionyl-tRNA formyltransferase